MEFSDSHSSSSENNGLGQKRDRPGNINSENEPSAPKTICDYQIALSENQLNSFNRNFSQLKNDFSILESYEKKFFKDSSLDVMFIMDITGSMGMWLNEAKENIQNIINEIVEHNPMSNIRLSFVGYRDYVEGEKSVGQYVFENFTPDIKRIHEFIAE
ncbi:MAG: VWA domain-containing protein [archaeon]|nr:VWA domain-containing protein [archaeon]